MEKQIEEFLNYLSLKGKAPSTIKNYRRYLLEFNSFAKCNVEDLTLDTVDRFHSRLVTKNISLVTQSYYLITIRSFLKFLRVRKELPVLDPLRIDLPKTRRKMLDALSEDEVKRLLKVAPFFSEYNIRARAIIEFLLGSGVRVAELCSLKVSDIDLKQKWFRVTGKGNKQRLCFINNDMVVALKKYLATRRNNSIYLFTRYDKYEDGKPITTRSIERLVKECGIKAGITKPVTPHVLRRTFAAKLLRKNVDIRYIQEFLGHDSLQTTQWYTKIEQNELEKVYRIASSKTSKNVKKETEQIIISRESLNKLRGMIGNTMRNQNEILREIREKKEVKIDPVVLIKSPTVN